MFVQKCQMVSITIIQHTIWWGIHLITCPGLTNSKQMKPGSFKSMMESMAKHMTGKIKRGGPEATKAMKKHERPTYKEPNKPKNLTKKQELKFVCDYEHWMWMELNII